MIYINPYLSPTLAPYLIGYYKMENRIAPGSDDSVQDEIFPYCNISVSSYVSFGPGKFGNAAITDVAVGNGRISTTTDFSKYSFTNGTSDIPFSISLWLYMTGRGTSYGYLIGKNALGTGAQANHAEYAVYIDTSNRIVYRKWSEGLHANSRTFTSTAISQNQWVHIAITDDAAGNVKIYANGVALTLTATNQGTGFVKFGTTTNSTFSLFNTAAAAGATALYGKIDDVGILNIALTESQVQFIYNAGTGRILKQ